MINDLTPIESASYCAYNFSYNLYNDILLFVTLNMFSFVENLESNSIGSDHLNEDEIKEELYEQIIVNSKYKTIGTA